jgi:excisionase family DNA binding protein
MSRIYTPAMLAREWECSERHIRNLIAANELRAFRLGGKLLRIPADAVEDFKCRNTASSGSGAGSPSSIETPEDNATVTRLEPIARLKLAAARRPSTHI